MERSSFQQRRIDSYTNFQDIELSPQPARPGIHPAEKPQEATSAPPSLQSTLQPNDKDKARKKPIPPPISIPLLPPNDIKAIRTNEAQSSHRTSKILKMTTPRDFALLAPKDRVVDAEAQMEKSQKASFLGRVYDKMGPKQKLFWVFLFLVCFIAACTLPFAMSNNGKE